jgi:hypothetical protein
MTGLRRHDSYENHAEQPGQGDLKFFFKKDLRPTNKQNSDLDCIELFQIIMKS